MAAPQGGPSISLALARSLPFWPLAFRAFAPETILTENNKQRIPTTQQTSHLIRRLGTVEDVAQAALYLASDNAARKVARIVRGIVTLAVLLITAGAALATGPPGHSMRRGSVRRPWSAFVTGIGRRPSLSMAARAGRPSSESLQ